jgi:hypothetical protein
MLTRRNVDIESNGARYDAWQLTTSLLYYGGRVISFSTQTVLLYRLLSTIESRWVSPALFAIWGIRALPSLKSEKTRMWTACGYRVVLAVRVLPLTGIRQAAYRMA